jgi:hypothetical protein
LLDRRAEIRRQVVVENGQVGRSTRNSLRGSVGIREFADAPMKNRFNGFPAASNRNISSAHFRSALANDDGTARVSSRWRVTQRVP